MSVRWVRQVLTVVLLLAASVLFLGEFLAGAADRAQPAQASAPPVVAPTFTVVRAAKPIARGSVIRPGDFQVEESATAPKAGEIASVQDASDRVATRDIPASEPLSQLNTTPADGISISQVIPPGLRAVALHVSEDTAVINLIRPGDRVDVLAISNVARTPAAASRLFPPAQAVTVLQNVPVLAVGGATIVADLNTSKAPVRTVALAVTPRQAAMVALIRSVGTEYLSLRPGSDDSEVATPAVSTDDLQPNQPAAQRPAVAAAPAAPPRERVRTIEVIAGKSDNVSRVSLAEKR